MATEFTFNTKPGETIARELLIAYLNVGASAEEPQWAAIGKRVEDSSEEFDWSEETLQDILGRTYTSLKKPIITQSFDPLPLDAEDKAAQKLWQLAVYGQNAQALANQDMLIAHFYTGESGETLGSFAERYSACAVRVTGLGGEGGGNLTMPIEVTYGGDRSLGGVKREGGQITFTGEAA